MRRSRRPRSSAWLIALATVVGAAAWAAPAAHAAAPTWHFGPLNPAFVAYQQQQHATQGHGARVGTLVPLPVNPRPWAKSALRHGPLAAQGGTSAISYDPRDPLQNPNVAALPAVRDQGYFNDCWAFASLGSLEFSLLPAVNDFSEDNLAVPAGLDFDYGPDGGGNCQMAAAELARWNGPVAQSSDVNNGVYVAGLPATEHVQNVFFLPDRTSTSDNESIKAAVATYGAVYTGMYADPYMSSGTGGAYYEPSTHAYYYDGSADTDHGVDIVGWNDAYPATNFKATRRPPGDGAFIVRNSWGSGWGESGYFYVSYYDTRIASTMAVFTGEDIGRYAQNLGHDRLGLTYDIGYNSDTGWMAAGYTVKGDSALEAAAFYTLSPGTTYDVYVGSALNDPSTWTAEASGTIDAAGYHTVDFAQSWAAKAGVKFYVIVRLTTPTTLAPIPIEAAIPDYSSRATTAPGQSYISPNGSAGSWDDAGVSSRGLRADVCLKVFAGPAAPDPIKPVTRALAAVRVIRGRYATLRYRVNDATPHDTEKVTIRITNRTGKTVKTLTVSGRAPNTSLALRYRCMLARGAYHFCVYATDRWGNPQTSRGRAALTVR